MSLFIMTELEEKKIHEYPNCNYKEKDDYIVIYQKDKEIDKFHMRRVTNIEKI
jgi:hypothetical protein